MGATKAKNGKTVQETYLVTSTVEFYSEVRATSPEDAERRVARQLSDRWGFGRAKVIEVERSG